MSYLGIDLETYCAADLKAVGAHRYAEDPSFEVLLFGFAFDDDDPTVIDLTAHEPIPKDVLDALRLNGIIKSGWNIAFERACLARHLGFDQPAGQWEDTMVLASVCGLPMGLGDCGATLHMSADKAKDKDGKALIRWFCKPCKPTKTRPNRTRHMPEDYPEKWSRFVAYNGQDVVAERAIRKTLARWAPTGVERKIWAVDQQINDRGIRVDLTLANAAREMDRAYKAELTQQAIALTGMENPNSVEQVKQWLEEQEDIEVPSLNKKVVADVVAALSTDTAKQFMAIRSELARSSTKKFDAMVLSACADDHVRGCFQFCGAGRTGRWCLTGDHEVLTPNGWVRLDDWTGGDIICWNRASEQLSFQKSSALCFPYEGPMIKITSQRCAQISTPDHKMAVADYKGTWADKMAGELVGQSFRLPFTGYRQKPVAGPSASNAELRVLIMTQADGHYTADGCLRFHFKKERKIKRCRVLLRRVELPYTEHENGDRTTTITVLSRHLPIWLRQFRSKTYGPWLLNEDPVTFFDELEHWDAYRCGPNSIQYTTTTKQNADLVQALAVTSGLSATLVEKPRDNERWSTAYAVNIWLNPGRVSRITGRQTETTGFSGVVYCAETPTGYFMVRREGKVWITGNSGRRVQLQNLAKNKMPDLAACRALVRSGDLEGVKLLYGDVASALSELVRTALIPEEGHQFIVCDYSAIEARVLAWIAGEEWALEEFRGKGQIYEATGAMMFHVPKETIAKGGCNHHRRQAAKTAVLACVAEGQLVLTDRGPVPIEQVTTNDMVWDGESWVRHEGLIRRGRKQVTRVNGVEITMDHKILTEKGMVACGKAGGLNWAHIRLPYSPWPWGAEAPGERAHRADLDVPVRMRKCENSSGRPPYQEEKADSFLWLYVPEAGCTWAHNTWNDEHKTVQRLESDEGTLLQPERQKLAEIRGPRNHGLRQVDVELPEFPGGYGADLQTRVTDRTQGRLTWVFPRELHLGDQITAGQKQEEQHRGGLPMGAYDTSGSVRSDRYAVLDPANQVLSEAPVDLSGRVREAETFDLLNAGPRHRFCLIDMETGVLRCVSNCGYGGGKNALLAFGADKMGMSDEDMIETVDLWRKANPNAVRLWKDLERAAIRCVVHGTTQVSRTGHIRFDFERGILWMTLPSGRRIAYFGAQYGESRWRNGRTLSYMGIEQKTHKWARLETWGGKLTENLVQATARDCLRDAMIHLTDAGFDIRAHIHDEVVITEPLRGRTVEDVAAIMGQDLPWAPGLPLRGDGYTCDFYMKDG